MRTAYRLIAAVALSLALWPISVTSAQSPQADWTILIYLDGDNNLERNAIDDFIEMAVVGSSAQVNVIVQFDRVAGYDARYGDWTGTLRFRVTQGMTPESDNALADIGELNMGDPQTLIDFVSWGKAAFPAQRTALVLCQFYQGAAQGDLHRHHERWGCPGHGRARTSSCCRHGGRRFSSRSVGF